MPPKVFIIGSGPAGYTAGIYAARAGLSATIISGIEVGGQLSLTTDVENYPGFANPIQGPWLMEQMREQASNVGVSIIGDYVTGLSILDGSRFQLETDKESYRADAVVIATGAQARWLGVKGESKYQGFGVSACATCDGFFFKGKRVIVIGGGNTAVEEAIYLTNHVEKVTLVHRRDELRAEKIMQKRLFANKKVEILWDTVLKEIIGDEDPLSVTGVVLHNLKDDVESRMEVDGVFIAIGHVPNTSLFKGKIAMDEQDYIVTDLATTKTNVPGVFAAGDVQDKVYRQAVTAAATGCMAALDAAKYLAEK